jgi:uncharacterized damage-inducible protein DinB
MTFRHLTIAAAFALTAAAPAAAQMNAQQDREKAGAYLEETRAKFLKSIEGLTEAQWTFKPSPTTWSIAEVAEHIAISESTILGLIQEKMLTAPPPNGGETMPDEKVIASLVDRTSKFQAPEMLKPTNKWETKEALVKDFNGARDKTIEFVKTTKEDLRAHAAPHPVLKTLDTHQWVLLIAGHSARHTLQIEEVKAAAGYPKN